MSQVSELKVLTHPVSAVQDWQTALGLPQKPVPHQHWAPGVSQHYESGKSVGQARNANTVLRREMALAEELARDVNPANANTQVAPEKAISVTSLPAVPPSLGSPLPSFSVPQAASGSRCQDRDGKGHTLRMGGITPCTQRLASGLLTFHPLQKLECETAALRRKSSVAATRFAKSVSLFLVVSGVWEGNAGN